jgi:hypothetical protein
MSIDGVALLNDLANTVAIGILAMGAYRALEIRKGFASSSYRSRATWSAFMLSVIGVSQVLNYSDLETNAMVSGVLGSSIFLGVIVVVFVFVDRSVTVAIQTDFFHRNTLRWTQARFPIGVVIVGSLVISTLVSYLVPPFSGLLPPPGSPLWATLGALVYIFGLPLGLGFSTLALILAAKRTADRTLKRNILFLGLALSTLVVSIVLSFPFNIGTLGYSIVNQGTGLVGFFLLYKSVMSLSPLGHIDARLAVAPAPDLPSGPERTNNLDPKAGAI